MKVLVAEDERASLLTLAATVGGLGHQCLSAPDGQAAWELYLRHSPDVLITDWLMPQMDGAELCRRVRAHPGPRYTHVVLLTTLGAIDDILAGMEAGADDYLVKPLDPIDLKARLTAAERVTKVHEQLAASRAQLEEANAELSRTARTDALTEIGNRRRLEEDLEHLDARARRQGRSYSVALCDIDFFKAYNDCYGHQGGDRALRSVAQCIVQTCRQGDEVYRYGGEELVVVYPDESLQGAIMAAGRVRRAVEALRLAHPSRPGGGVLTVSVGVAALNVNRHPSHKDVVSEADEALYCAKDAGRNSVHPPAELVGASTVNSASATAVDGGSKS